MIDLKLVLLVGVICLNVGCVPVEDTTPSSALFPTTGRYASASIGGLAPVRTDFSKLLQTNAPRRKAELMAMFGTNYISAGHSKTNAAWEDLKTGSCHLKDGKQAYRVTDIYQAQQVLKKNWHQQDWSPYSDLGKAFQKVPNATIVKLSATDQRILFFNEANRLVGCYPSAN